jgi:hypothetical protein
MPDVDLKAIRDRIWSFGRDTEVSHVDGFTKRADYRQLCYDVIDAVIEIRETGQIRAEHIDSFAKAAQCSFEFVFSCGLKRLIETTHFSELAADKLRALASDPQWTPRFNVMCCMSYGPPVALGLEILATGLKDRSEKVACRAAQSCDEFAAPAGLELLQSRLPVENRRKVREGIEFAIECMRAPWVREGRQETRSVRGVVFSRDVRPENKGR